MIFVTVGNATQGFPRFLEAVESLAMGGAFRDEEILVQTGNNPGFHPSLLPHVPFLSMDRFARIVGEADLIISHGGAGTLFHVLRTGKIPVVVPRQKRFGEHVDDHQVELVRALESTGRVIAVYDEEKLGEAVEKARVRNRQTASPPPSRMLHLVEEAIQELLGWEPETALAEGGTRPPGIVS